MCTSLGFGENGVRLDIVGPRRSVVVTKKDVKAQTKDPQDEREKGTKAMTDGAKLVSGDNPLCHRMSRP